MLERKICFCSLCQGDALESQWGTVLYRKLTSQLDRVLGHCPQQTPNISRLLLCLPWLLMVPLPNRYDKTGEFLLGTHHGFRSGGQVGFVSQKLL